MLVEGTPGAPCGRGSAHIAHIDEDHVDAQSIELARRAVALLRDVLTSGAIQSSPPLRVTEGSATSRATHGLAIHLLQRCVDPADL
jgi:hypothetical protein